MDLFNILCSSSNADPLSLRFLVIILNTFSSYNPFQGLGGHTHRIFFYFHFQRCSYEEDNVEGGYS